MHISIEDVLNHPSLSLENIETSFFANIIHPKSGWIQPFWLSFNCYCIASCIFLNIPDTRWLINLAGNMYPGVTQKPDNSLKGIRNPIPRNPDDPLKGIQNLVPNEIWGQWPIGLTVPT